VIEANLKACIASHEAAGQSYNIAYGGREYLIDIYYELCKVLGKDIEPVFGRNGRVTSSTPMLI
jgi:UDP-N-acetylglucosamine 4-epimerase